MPICFQVKEVHLDANILGEQMHKGMHLEGQVGYPEKSDKIWVPRKTIPELGRGVPTVSCPPGEDFQ